MTAETEIMRSEIARVMARAHPPAVMSLQDIADFFGFSYQHAQKEIACKPDFPSRLDRFKQPRWARGDVLKWAQVEA